MTIRTYGRLDRTHHGSSDRTNLVPLILPLFTISTTSAFTTICSESILCFVKSSTSISRKLPKPECNVESELAILDLQAFHQLTAKMQSPQQEPQPHLLPQQPNILITILVFRFHLTFDILRRSPAQGIQSLLKLVVVPVISRNGAYDHAKSYYQLPPRPWNHPRKSITYYRYGSYEPDPPIRPTNVSPRSASRQQEHPRSRALFFSLLPYKRRRGTLSCY